MAWRRCTAVGKVDGRVAVAALFGHVEGPRRAKPGQGPFTELLFLAVVPEMERKGYGRAMLSHVHGGSFTCRT